MANYRGFGGGYDIGAKDVANMINHSDKLLHLEEGCEVKRSWF
jgi:hypothetical protein